VHDETGQSASEQADRIGRELFLRAFSPSPPPPELSTKLAGILRDVYAKPGDVLFERGDESTMAYFIVSGEIRLVGDDDEDPIPFGPGSIVGMLDLNIGRRRARTGIVSMESHVLALPYDAWLELMEDAPAYTATTRCVVARGVHEIVLALPGHLAFEPSDTPAFPNAAFIYRIAALRKPLPFQTARVETLIELAKRATVLRAEPGELIAPPGPSSDRLFVVMRGRLDVERRVAPELVASFGPGQLVLGSAAFGGALRSYAVSAGAPTVALVLDHADIDAVGDDRFDLVRSALRGMSVERDRLMGLRARRLTAPPPAPKSAVPPAPASAERGPTP
jgi:CRP-like cAMP-binding protein